MLRILEQSPQSIHQTNLWGQTPLHLAVGWPLGMKMLLQYGANADSRDNFGVKPLEYAIRLGFAEAVLFLMRAGCSLYLNGRVDALSFANEIWSENGLARLRAVSQETRKTVLETVITLLAERRHDLQSHMVTSLPRKSADACWTPNDQVLDEHAPYVEELLSSQGLLLPRASSLLPLPTVYHVHNLTVELAEMMWQAGFRDVDAPDSDGRTPLMYHGVAGEYLVDLRRGIKLTSWLIKRGANIHRWQHSCVQAVEVTDQKPTKNALHHMAAGIGFCARNRSSYHLDKTEQFGQKQEFSPTVGVQQLRDEINRQSKSSREFLAEIFSNTTSDRCLCACSTRGCLASTIIQRTVCTQLCIRIWRKFETGGYGSYAFAEVLHSRELAMLMTETVIALLGSHNECQTWLADALIRFQTFQELGLRHTCCRYDTELRYFTEHEPDEVNEIRNEDSEGIELLEALMIEFSEKRKDQDVMTFLKGYWTTRLDDISGARGRVDKDKLKEIGVDLDENGSERSDIEEFKDVRIRYDPGWYPAVE